MTPFIDQLLNDMKLVPIGPPYWDQSTLSWKIPVGRADGVDHSPLITMPKELDYKVSQDATHHTTKIEFGLSFDILTEPKE
jgi:hypothetical protein